MTALVMTRHFVTFYSPGTLVAETTTKPIYSWDVETAKQMAAKITERHGARPYAFAFTTRGRSEDDLDSKETARSCRYYLGGRIRTLEEVRADAVPDERILLSNMEGNDWKRVWESTSGWKWTQPLGDDDVVLDV